MTTPMNVGILLFDNMTMVDAYGPLQVLAFMPQMRTFTFAHRAAPVLSDSGARLTPDYDFASCPALDILVVPGGGAVLPQMRDDEAQQALRRLAASARYVTSNSCGATRASRSWSNAWSSTVRASAAAASPPASISR
mgnify:CR=1 FL=1